MHLAPLALALLAPLALPQTTYLVDADGLGDFLDLQSAVDAAVDGDLILVDSDDYPQLEPVLISKRLTVAGLGGDDRPFIGHIFVSNTSDVTLTRLHLQGFAISNVSGTVNLDSLLVTPKLNPLTSQPLVPPPAGYAPPFPLKQALIEDADDVRIIRSTLFGTLHPFLEAIGSDALTVRGASRVTIGSSVLDCPDIPSSGHLAGWGGHAVVAGDTSFVRVVDSHLVGGAGEHAWSLGFIVDQGKGGNGLLLTQSASAQVLFNGAKGVEGGINDPFPMLSWGADARNLGVGSLTIEGAPAELEVQGPANLLPAQTPFLAVAVEIPYWSEQLPPPGAEWALLPHGAPGSAGMLALSPAPALQPVAGLQGLLELNAGPAAVLVPFAFTGWSSPPKFAWTPPSTPGITGIVMYAQAAAVPPGGAAWVATNSAHFALNQ